jgi:hypothetical protein
MRGTDLRWRRPLAAYLKLGGDVGRAGAGRGPAGHGRGLRQRERLQELPNPLRRPCPRVSTPRYPHCYYSTRATGLFSEVGRVAVAMGAEEMLCRQVSSSRIRSAEPSGGLGGFTVAAHPALGLCERFCRLALAREGWARIRCGHDSDMPQCVSGLTWELGGGLAGEGGRG